MKKNRVPDPSPQRDSAIQYLTWALEEFEKFGHQKAALQLALRWTNYAAGSAQKHLVITPKKRSDFAIKPMKPISQPNWRGRHLDVML